MRVVGVVGVSTTPTTLRHCLPAGNMSESDSEFEKFLQEVCGKANTKTNQNENQLVSLHSP